MNLDDDLDNPASEVELDSLGSFFIHLIDNDYYQDDAEGSKISTMLANYSFKDGVPKNLEI